MKALVVGASGFLGSNLGFFLTRNGWHVEGVSRTAIDFFPKLHLASTEGAIDQLISDGTWDVVLNAVALASHEECERDPERAHLVNVVLPSRWAGLARERGMRFVHFSTDAVFEGCGHPPYSEDDTPCPVGVYARTKEEGERGVVASNSDALVLRTNFFGWSHQGSKGILDFFVRSLENHRAVTGFTDYVVSSLYVGDLAEALSLLVQREARGIVHCVAYDSLSKYDLGQEIAEIFGLDGSLIRPGSIDEAGLDVARGKNLSLSTEKINSLIGHLMPTSASGVSRALRDREHVQQYFAGESPS